jgi:hypothetical protein
MFWTLIQEMLSSNLRPYIVYPDCACSWFSSVPTDKLGRVRFLLTLPVDAMYSNHWRRRYVIHRTEQNKAAHVGFLMP